MQPDLLTASQLRFAYGERPVLRDVSVHLRGGEVVALIGPNGSGKSTLIKVLLGTLRGTGSIEWSGKRMHLWRRRELARQVAYLAQSPGFEPEQPVADVLRLGRAAYWGAFGIESASDVRRVREVAERLDLADVLDRPMVELSGGQRQRVFVGRCLVQGPRAMLLDEPNTFLDLRHQIDLGRLIRDLAKRDGIGVLMASHDLNLAATFADRLVLLSAGAIVADGAPAAVLAPDLLRQVYGLEMRRVEQPGSNVPIIVPRI